MDKNDTILITDSDDSEQDYPHACTWGEFLEGNQDFLDMEFLQHMATALDKNEPYYLGGGAATTYRIEKLQLDRGRAN